jgi:ribonuclease D
MQNFSLPPAKIIRTTKALSTLIKQLKQEPRIAFDTESNSLHAYRERVCLIQISTQDQDYIVDPLSVDAQPLGEIFADEKIEKIFHAAEYDLMCLKRDYSFIFTNLFDTMMAARICGLPAYGLGTLLQEYEGITLDKRHQRDDWGKRPLPQDSLQYAQMDTHYLLSLRDRFRQMLIEQGRMEEALEAFEELCAISPAGMREFDKESYWHIGKPNKLNAQELLVLRELVEVREKLAKKRNLPPYKVLNNSGLIALSKKQPTTMPELKNMLAAKQIRRYAKDILYAIKRGKASTQPARPPAIPMPDPVVAERYAMLHTWRKERAAGRGVDSDVIISKQALWDIAETAPNTLDDLRAIKSIGTWKFNAYGQEIIHVLSHNQSSGD